MPPINEDEKKLIAELDEDFQDAPDYVALSDEEKLRIIRVMIK